MALDKQWLIANMIGDGMSLEAISHRTRAISKKTAQENCLWYQQF